MLVKFSNLFNSILLRWTTVSLFFFVIPTPFSSFSQKILTNFQNYSQRIPARDLQHSPSFHAYPLAHTHTCTHNQTWHVTLKSLSNCIHAQCIVVQLLFPLLFLSARTAWIKWRRIVENWYPLRARSGIPSGACYCNIIKHHFLIRSIIIKTDREKERCGRDKKNSWRRLLERVWRLMEWTIYMMTTRAGMCASRH